MDEKTNKELYENDILDMVYEAKEAFLDKKIQEINKTIESKMHNINIEEIIKNEPNKEALSKVFEKLEDNYNIKISNYNKEFYKQGFKDGINMVLSCLK